MSSRSSCSVGAFGCCGCGLSAATLLPHREALRDDRVRHLVQLELDDVLDRDVVAVDAMTAADGGEDAVLRAGGVRSDGLLGEGREDMTHPELAGDAVRLEGHRAAMPAAG